MNKKTKLKLELDETIKAQSGSVDSCPICSSHFSCALSRESHFKLYPTHQTQTGTETPLGAAKEAAVVENLQGKIRTQK